MATKESQRTMKSRRAHDQVSFLMGKGGRELLRVLALRGGKDYTAAEVLRSAVLVTAGLRKMPSAADLADLRTVTTPAEAEAAIMRLQDRDETEWSSSPDAGEQNHKFFVRLSPDEWDLILSLSDQIEDALKMQNSIIAKHGMDAPGLDSIYVLMLEDDLLRLRRIVANTEYYILRTKAADSDDEETDK